VKILEVHSRVNTIEEVEEVKDYFDVFYVIGIYKSAAFSWNFNKHWKLDGSLFAIEDYKIEKEMIELIKEIKKKTGKKVIVDFIPNHLGKSPYNYPLGFADKRIGHWEWGDTVQLNYTSLYTLNSMLDNLTYILSDYWIDGLRFDMAHLLLRKNYNLKHSVELGYEPLQELISKAREERPDSILVAEAYIDYDSLKDLGFDYVYRIEPRRNQYFVEKERDLVIIDNHDEKMLYWYYGGSLYHLENNLKRLNSFKNTLWYLPAIMGYLKRPSANYWYNKKWEKSKEIKEIYLKVLSHDKKGMV